MRRMKIKKQGILGLLTAMTLGLTACSSGPSFAERTEDALAHMKEKYGVEFQVDWDSQAVTREYHSWNLSPVGNTDEELRGAAEVHFFYGEEDTGADAYKDTYFAVMVEEPLQKKVEEILKDKLGGCKVYVNSGSDFVDNKYTSLEQLEEYLEETKSTFSCHSISLTLKDLGSEEANAAQVQEYLDLLRAANMGNPYMSINCVSEEVYEQVSKDRKVEYPEIVYRYGSRLIEKEK